MKKYIIEYEVDPIDYKGDTRNYVGEVVVEADNEDDAEDAAYEEVDGDAFYTEDCIKRITHIEEIN